MASICSTPFLNATSMWDLDRPYLSECFLYSIMTFPCVLIWIGFIPYLHYIYKRSRPLPIPHNILNNSRLICAGSILVATSAKLGETIYDLINGSDPDIIKILSPSIVILTILLSSILMICERRFGVITSPLNFTFSFLMVIASGLNMYALIANALDKNQFGDVYHFVVEVVLLLSYSALFVITCFSDYDIGTMGLNLNVCALSRASVLSQLTFWWINSLVYVSYKKDLKEEDVFQLRPEDEVQDNYRSFQEAWDDDKRKFERERAIIDQLPNDLQTADDTTPIVSAGEDEPTVESRGTARKPHVFKILVRVFAPMLLFGWTFKLFYDVLNFVNPLILKVLIDYTGNPSEPSWHGGMYAAAYLIVGILSSICFHQNFHFSLLSGMRIRSALTSAIYRKSLWMSNEARSKSTVGEIVNLMSVDAQRICDCLGFLWFAWSATLQITICIALLWNELEVAVLAGVGVLLVFVPINGIVMSKLQKYEEKEMEWKDKRVKLLTEVLSGMKILKLYAWEPSYEDRISALRKTELSYTRKVMFGWGFVVVVWSIAPYMVMLVSFATYIYSSPDKRLTAQKAFVSLTLFNMLRFPMTMLPWGISTCINAYVSLKRINAFFNSDDLDQTSTESRSVHDNGPSISVTDGTFSWTKEGQSVLKNINLDVPKGQLVAVVGSVGSGKSSLISAILGELEKKNGTVIKRGSIAYVPQQAWIQHMSVQDNILFGSEMDRHRYEEVLDCCALRPDLKLLPNGDQTEIGERGVNLSGGQKQRISLARAVYQQSDIYLLDDPLSAVDAHVGNQLFDKVIGSEGLIGSKTRLLVTHGLQWLPTADLVVVLNNGMISEIGTFQDLIARPDGELAVLVREHMNNEKADESEETQNETEDEYIAAVSTSFHEFSPSSIDSDHGSNSDRMVRFLSRQRSEIGSDKRSITPVMEEEAVKLPVVQVEEESMETGHVSWSAYGLLLRGRGYVLTALTLLCYAGFTGIGVGSNFWLSAWADDKILNNASIPAAINRERTDYYLEYYGIFGVGQMVVITGFAMFEAFSSIRASIVLHKTMLKRIMRAPMSFFDTTPIGRIINRFGKDMETIDHELPGNLNDFVECFMAVLSSVIVITQSTPYFLIAIIPLAIAYVIIQKFYIPISRQSRRLDSVTRSSIYTHFTESVMGAQVIRAFGHQNRFFNICDSTVNKNARFFFVKVSSNRWLGFRLEVLSCLIVFSAILMAILGRNTLSAGIVGLSISYALQVTDNLNWMVRQITEIETNAVAVERIQGYSEIEQEAAWEEDEKPEDRWPMEGRIRFHRYSTRYRPGLDLVLKQISVQINPGETVGIVGRTGAGKSSLTLALFRLIEAVDGQIEVDRKDISNMGLHQVRGRLTILPQDPVLFSGSLRENLDPFFQFSDDDVWRCLELSRLASWVRQQEEALQHEVGEGGSNLSVGQRQLVCLTRALLRRSKVLVLDEATAAVDVETDRLIMTTIREQFKDSTILIIAHRLTTIMDADRVLVFDRGQVKEFDTPDNLLKNKESLFYSLAEHAGIVKPQSVE